MYTQCPECNSVFEITATDLAVAGGFVRCGQCAVSFDALNSLSDNSAALDAPPGPSKAKTELESLKSRKQQAKVATATDEKTEQDQSETLTADTGPDSAELKKEPAVAEPADHTDDEAGEIIELDSCDEESSSADSDFETVDNEEQAAADASLVTVTEQADIDDDEILLDDAYEPPSVDDDEEFYDDDDGDTLVAAKSEFDRLTDNETDTADAAGETEEAEEAEKAEQADESALFALPLPELTALEHPEHGMLPEKLEGGQAAHEPSAQSQTPARARQPATDTTVTAPVTQSPWLRTNDAYDAQDARDLKDYLSAPSSRMVNAAWIGGTALMALLLVGQVIHRYRGDLVIHPRFGPVVQSLYQSVGVDLRPNWQVNEYKVVGQARLFLMPLDGEENTGASPAGTAKAGETGHPDSTAIRFVAIITNGAKLPQPAPLVRLTLRDRWGDPTGARTFTPPEYLADRTMIGQLLEPGQRLRVVLNLYDFGSDAVGFDFDMCLPDDRGTLRCAHDG